MQSYDSVLFFDNEVVHIDCFKDSGVKAIKVPGASEMPSIPITFDEYKAYVASLSSPARAFAEKIVHKCVSKTAYDPISGIDVVRDKPIFDNWASENGGKKLAVVFDFDRTLTKVETFLSSTGPSLPHFHGWEGFKPLVVSVLKTSISDYDDVTPEGWVEYYMGGRARMDAVKEFLQDINAKGIDIYVLTNNGSALYNPELLNDFLSVLTDGLNIGLIASATHPSKKAALSGIDGFVQVCETVSIPVEDIFQSIVQMLKSAPTFDVIRPNTIKYKIPVKEMGLLPTATV